MRQARLTRMPLRHLVFAANRPPWSADPEPARAAANVGIGPARVTLAAWRRAPAVSLFDARPELRTIWAPELAAIAAEHTAKWETDLSDRGCIFTAHLAGELIGVTGWYRMSDSEAGLRWHGVLPHARRRGLSRQMLGMVCQALPREIRHVFEVTRNPQSKLAFCEFGFEEVLDPAVIRRAVEHADYDIAGGGYLLRKTLELR